MCNPKIFPIANGSIKIQLLELLNIALSCNQLKRGANETIKELNRGNADMVIIAADTEPLEIIMQLPLLCEDKNIPYIFVHGKKILGKVCGISSPVISCVILKNTNSKIISKISIIHDYIENKIN